MSDANEVTVYINKTQPVIMDDFSEDGQWELLGISARNENKTNGKTRIRFSLLLKRRTTFYIVNIIVPVMMLSIVSTLVFALPADAGEKMGMGITVLLAYAVYLTIVSDHLPSTSKQISLLALYLTILLGVTAFSILVEVFILRLHHKPESELVGSKTARFSLCLRAVTCSSSRRTEARRPQKNSHAQNNFVLNGDPTRYMTRPDFHPTPDYEFITWPEVAASLDWFCFVLFTTLNIMTTVAFIVALVVGAAKNNPTLPPNYTYTDEF